MAIGKFEVLGELGRGAGSTLVKVRRESDKKVYALKIVRVQSAEDQKYVEQVKLEYDVANTLTHPHLCKAFELDLDKTLFGKVRGAKLLLEFVDGQPLSLCKGFPVSKYVVMFYRIADAVAHMHALGYYHADIKPENVMVTRTGDVKVIDFGLVWRRGETKDRVQGTLDFLAPEQAKKKQVNARTDIFNFGATMYKVLTGLGVPPEFHEKGASKLGRVDDLVKPVAYHNAAVPEPLSKLVCQCMRYHPEERPETMKEVKRALRAVAKEMAAG